MPKLHFQHVTDWVFDLDHTLYPPENRLFDQIETKMTDYIVALLGTDPASANALRNRYCLLYTSPSPRDATLSRMPSSA